MQRKKRVRSPIDSRDSIRVSSIRNCVWVSWVCDIGSSFEKRRDVKRLRNCGGICTLLRHDDSCEWRIIERARLNWRGEWKWRSWTRRKFWRTRLWQFKVSVRRVQYLGVHISYFVAWAADHFGKRLPRTCVFSLNSSPNLCTKRRLWDASPLIAGNTSYHRQRNYIYSIGQPLPRIVRQQYEQIVMRNRGSMILASGLAIFLLFWLLLSSPSQSPSMRTSNFKTQDTNVQPSFKVDEAILEGGSIMPHLGNETLKWVDIVGAFRNNSDLFRAELGRASWKVQCLRLCSTQSADIQSYSTLLWHAFRPNPLRRIETLSGLISICLRGFTLAANAGPISKHF